MLYGFDYSTRQCDDVSRWALGPVAIHVARQGCYNRCERVSGRCASCLLCFCFFIVLANCVY